MTGNPERFIESNTETSWLQYLSRMSMQGTWADNIVIQAVASDDNFRDVTIVGKGKESDPTDASANMSANASTDSWSTVGRQLVDSRPTVGRLSADSRPTR